MEIKDFKLERFFAEYEFKTPYLLCTSDCESFSIKELLELEKCSERELKKLRLSYTESQGSEALRREIAKLYENIKPEEVFVFSGAEEGIFIFMNVVARKGDGIIVQYPAYQSLYEIANSIGCKVTKWPMNEQNGWELDVNFLNGKIRPNTKAIVINCPHNPTGYLMSKDKFNHIINIAKSKDIAIFSDEVYRFLEYSKKDRLPAACDIYEKGVSLGVMSKAFGLAGLRIGWIATKDKVLLQRIAAFRDYTTICNSAPSEFLAILALRHKEQLIKRNLKIIKDNIRLLDRFFAKYCSLFEWSRPKAGTLAFLRIKAGKSAEEFCMDAQNKIGVLLLPSTKYDFGDEHFRIGFGKKDMPKALKKLEDYIKIFNLKD